MYEAIQKTWSSSKWQLASNILGFPKVQSMCGAITTRPKAADRYAGKPGAECNQEWRHFNSAKTHGNKGLDKSKQPKRRNERVNRVWTYRKDKARKSLRLQSLCYHALPTQLRHEEAGRVFRKLQAYRLHGTEYQFGGCSNREQSRQVEAAKKINFRCPIGGRSTSTLSHEGTNSNFQNAEFGHFVPPRDKTPTFRIMDCPPTGHLYRLTIYMPLSGGVL